MTHVSSRERPAEGTREIVRARWRLTAVLGALFLVCGLTYSVLAPLLPGYKRELDASEMWLGALVASSGLGIVAGSVAARRLAALFRPRAVTTVGVLVTGGASVAFGFGDSLAVLIAARTFQGFGGGLVWVAGLQWLLGATPAAERGRVVGVVFGAETLGAMVGPAVGALAVSLSTRAVFGGLAGVTLMLGGVAGRIRLPAGARPAEAEDRVAGPPQGEPGAGTGRERRRAGGGLAIGIVASHAAAAGCVWTLAPLVMSDHGASGTEVAAVFIAGSGLAVLTSPATGWLSDRAGRLMPLRIGCVLDTLVLAGLAVTPSLPVAAALTVMWIGVVASAIAIPAATLLVDRSGGNLGGATAGMLIGFSGGAGAGALLSGAVADATSFAVPFALFAAIGLFTLGLVSRVPHRL